MDKCRRLRIDLSTRFVCLLGVEVKRRSAKLDTECVEWAIEGCVYFFTVAV